MASEHESALVLFSGGQDSLACLAWALQRFKRVETVGFDYGQRHHIELECRTDLLNKIRADNPFGWADRLGEDRVLDLRVLGQITQTALTRDAEIVMQDNGLLNTFVPGRNLIFLNFAGVVAYCRGIRHLVGGMCETDFSGYPDCRWSTLQTLMKSMNLGMESSFELHAPLMSLSKAQTWLLAEQLGGEWLVDHMISDTHTCYFGDRSHRHSWGYGCNTCPACELRSRGYEEYRAGKAQLPHAPVSA